MNLGSLQFASQYFKTIIKIFNKYHWKKKHKCETWIFSIY